MDRHPDSCAPDNPLSNFIVPSPNLRDEEGNPIPDSYSSALDLVSELAERYQISSLRSFLEVCRTAARRSDLSIAVLGRFKAGKSSFLNHLFGMDLLPVGVVPVTSVITDIAYGAVDDAEIRFMDGSNVHVPLSELRSYVAEVENPQNAKGVLSAFVRLPDLSDFPRIHFIDTPGLESALAHNTEASMAWAPNVDIALVTIAVDPPLSQQDVTLIRNLLSYTPKIGVVLTKFDLLAEPEQTEVADFVRKQLSANFGQEIVVYPYSTRPGYEYLRQNFKANFLAAVTSAITAHRRAITHQKVKTLVRECHDYLGLTLRSAEMLDSEKLTLQRQVTASRDAIADTKLSFQLAARHTTAGSRQLIERILAPDESIIRQELLDALEREGASFPNNLAGMIDEFGDWLRAALSSRLKALSDQKRNEFLQPIADVQRHYHRLLQNFRDRLSERTLALYGVPLRTTETEITPRPPKRPDVNIGRVFDHNWEILSPVIPMTFLRGAVIRRFRRKIADETFKNLSRLTSQWEEIVNSAALEVQREAERRIEELVTTVERLTGMPQQKAPRIRADLDRLTVIVTAIEGDE